MDRINNANMEQICAIAGMYVRPCRKQIVFNGERMEIIGYEVREDGLLIANWATIKGVVRELYVRCDSYDYTSHHGAELSHNYVLKATTRRALNKLGEVLNRR